MRCIDIKTTTKHVDDNDDDHDTKNRDRSFAEWKLEIGPPIEANYLTNDQRSRQKRDLSKE